MIPRLTRFMFEANVATGRMGILTQLWFSQGVGEVGEIGASSLPISCQEMIRLFLI